ncbi:MAG: PP2C family protein-serine/threonine phosphatase [Phycisphaerae bacterium]
MPEAAAQTPAIDRSLQLVCSEVWGGNRPVDAPVELPGIRGVLYSQPCAGQRGGDVHYLSVCGSGIMTRGCIADVVGHGETVARVSDEIHALMRRSMNRFDQRRVLRNLNRRLTGMGLDAMTTLAALTYYPPSRRLSVSYAGHPPGWYFSRAAQRWRRLELPPREGDDFADGPLAVDAEARYTWVRVRVDMGDRLLLLTDGVLETPGPAGEQFGDSRVTELLAANADQPLRAIGDELVGGLQAFAGPRGLGHDDITFLMLEFEPGPKYGTHAWLALRNRLMRPRGNSRSAFGGESVVVMPSAAPGQRE